MTCSRVVCMCCYREMGHLVSTIRSLDVNRWMGDLSLIASCRSIPFSTAAHMLFISEMCSRMFTLLYTMGLGGPLLFFFSRFSPLSPCTSYNSIQKTHKENKEASEQAFIMACTTTPQHGHDLKKGPFIRLKVYWDMVGHGWALVPPISILK